MNIYIIYLISVDEITQHDLAIGADKFSYVIEPQGYYNDYATAVEDVKSNIGDIYEAGAFPYVIISSVPLNTIYPAYYKKRTHTLFHFNDKSRQYEEISWNYNDATEILQLKGEAGYY